MHSNGLLLGGGYDDLRLRMEGCGGAEKFWSFGPKLPNLPPYILPVSRNFYPIPRYSRDKGQIKSVLTPTPSTPHGRSFTKRSAPAGHQCPPRRNCRSDQCLL